MKSAVVVERHAGAQICRQISNASERLLVYQKEQFGVIAPTPIGEKYLERGNVSLQTSVFVVKPVAGEGRRSHGSEVPCDNGRGSLLRDGRVRYELRGKRSLSKKLRSPTS